MLCSGYYTHLRCCRMGWLVGRLGQRGRGRGMTMGLTERGKGLRLRCGEEEEKGIDSQLRLVVGGFLGLLRM